MILAILVIPVKVINTHPGLVLLQLLIIVTIVLLHSMCPATHVRILMLHVLGQYQYQDFANGANRMCYAVPVGNHENGASSLTACREACGGSERQQVSDCSIIANRKRKTCASSTLSFTNGSLACR